MKQLRLVLVTRRFWPLVGGAESVIANLACQLQSRGDQVTILTARWQPGWPSEIVHRGVRVVRLAQPPIRLLGTAWYVHQLRRWLATHKNEVDLVYVSMLKHDAYAALASAGSSTAPPVVLRAEGAGASGDVHWQLEARFGRRIKRRCYHAAALVAPSAAIERELIVAGFPRDRIHCIPNGVPTAPEADELDRQRARTALAESHPALATEPATPVIVYTGRLHETKRLDALILAFDRVVASRPKARLWIVGEGPQRNALARQIHDANLAAWCVLPGAFDNVDDVLRAADVFVLPSREEGMSVALLEAMAARVPVVASDIPGNRALVDDGRHGLLVPVGDDAAIAAAIGRLLHEPAAAVELATAAADRVARDFSLAIMAESHRQLFADLIRRHRETTLP